MALFLTFCLVSLVWLAIVELWIWRKPRRERRRIVRLWSSAAPELRCEACGGRFREWDESFDSWIHMLSIDTAVESDRRGKDHSPINRSSVVLTCAECGERSAYEEVDGDVAFIRLVPTARRCLSCRYIFEGHGDTKCKFCDAGESAVVAIEG